jgi:hypothetical protein
VQLVLKVLRELRELRELRALRVNQEHKIICIIIKRREIKTLPPFV